MKKKNAQLMIAANAAGLTWKELASRSGCTAHTVHSILTGRKPSREIASAIAAALGMTAADLFDTVSPRPAYNTLKRRAIRQLVAKTAEASNA
jgi:transcriptional regulator with XRE-family HTH domain